jgi:ABC transport system ATP-binding/permease protein
MTRNSVVAGGPQWPEIDLRQRRDVVVGRSRSCDVVLPDHAVSARHAQFLSSPTGIEVEDLGSTGGTTVNGLRVRRTGLKPGDVVCFGSSPFAYRFFGDHLRVDTEHRGLAIRLEHVGLVRGNRKLLADVDLKIEAGSFVGVLGPSGTGKSLLLGCLATTLTPSSGTITFDEGRTFSGADLEYYRSRLGLVPQEDLVYGALTVRENVRFAAQLRLRDQTPQEQGALVEKTISDVGLTEHQFKQVAVLSGGQRKRLSVAIELLLRPRLLVLDEPTSGLDPGMQVNLMDRLRGLARQGITVVTSTHTMDTLHYFDSVVLLARRGGSTTCIFTGAPAALLPAFKTHDLPDLFEQLSREGDAPANSPATGHGVDPANSDRAAAMPTEEVGPLRAPAIAHVPPVRSVDRLVKQAEVVVYRTWAGFRRDRMSLGLALVQPVALAALITLSQKMHDKTIFIHTFVVVAAVWLGMTITVREIVRERPLYLRDRLAGLNPSSFLLGKVVFAAAVVTLQCILLYVACRLLLFTASTSVQSLFDNVNVWLGGAAVVAAGLAGTFIGLAISTLSRTEQAAVALLPLMILPQLLFSRVGIGEAGMYWHETRDYQGNRAAYTPIALFFDEGENGAEFKGKQESRFISLLMVSRPASAALDMSWIDLKADSNVKRWRIYEWIFLLVLLSLYLGVLVAVFRFSEKRWTSSR